MIKDVESPASHREFCHSKRSQALKQLAQRGTPRFPSRLRGVNRQQSERSRAGVEWLVARTTLFLKSWQLGNDCFKQPSLSALVLSPFETPEERCYFFAFFAAFVLASARRSVFLRRAARFFTLSLPWLFPIRPPLSPFRSRFQAISIRRQRPAHKNFISASIVSFGFSSRIQ